MSAAVAPLDIDYVLADEIVRGRKDGSLIRDKARMLYEYFALTKMADILQDPQQPVSVFMQIADHLAKTGDINPKANVQGMAGGGTGFSIQINMPNGQVAVGMPNITPTAPEPKTLTLSNLGTAEVDELPPKPPGFIMPDFLLSADLIGPPLKEAA